MPTGIYKRNLKSIKIGEKFGRLMIIKEIKHYIKSNERKVLCQCDCGNQKEILYNSLKYGHTRSCGCLRKENANIINFKHGMYKTRFYHIWEGIKARCNNKNYQIYGGRGITVCKKWLIFNNFKKDMYKNYLEHYKKFGKTNTTIDRIDNNGNYNKKNCKWATMKEQQNNRNNNVLITYNNKTQNFTQWSKELNINYNILYNKIKILNI